MRPRRATNYRLLSNFFDYGGTNGIMRKNCVWDVHIRKSGGDCGAKEICCSSRLQSPEMVTFKIYQFWRSVPASTAPLFPGPLQIKFRYCITAQGSNWCHTGMHQSKSVLVKPMVHVWFFWLLWFYFTFQIGHWEYACGCKTWELSEMMCHFRTQDLMSHFAVLLLKLLCFYI